MQKVDEFRLHSDKPHKLVFYRKLTFHKINSNSLIGKVSNFQMNSL